MLLRPDMVNNCLPTYMTDRHIADFAPKHAAIDIKFVISKFLYSVLRFDVDSTFVSIIHRHYVYETSNETKKEQ